MTKRERAVKRAKRDFLKRARYYGGNKNLYAIVASNGRWVEAQSIPELKERYMAIEERYFPLSDEERERGIPSEIEDPLTRYFIKEFRDDLRLFYMQVIGVAFEDFYSFRELPNKRILLTNRWLKVEFSLPRAKKDVGPLTRTILNTPLVRAIMLFKFAKPEFDSFYLFYLKDHVKPDDLNLFSKKFQTLLRVENPRLNIVINRNA